METNSKTTKNGNDHENKHTQTTNNKTKQKQTRKKMLANLDETKHKRDNICQQLENRNDKRQVAPILATGIRGWPMPSHPALAR